MAVTPFGGRLGDEPDGALSQFGQIPYYNFGRPHQSLGRNMTPAMAAGLSDHVWTCEEIAALLESN